MNRILFLIVFFFIPIQLVFSDSADSLKWIEMPVKTYPDYPVLINYIDSSCFNRHKKNYLSYASSVPIVKKKRTIKVKCANKTYKFKDSRNEDEQKYYVAGSYKSWIIIKGYLYYHFEQYYMINPKTGEIDSLAGEPLFYDDKILCIEGDNTDGTKMIEVWQIDDDTISLRYSADLKRRRIYDINDFYLFDDTIFLKLEERYLKMYYAKPTRVSSTYQGLQPFKYNGKELDRVHGLDWYDYGARRYDPAFVQFTQMDPLCEQYPHLSPYAYCAGNPVRYVDPDGRKIDLSLLDEKQQKRFKDQIDFVSNYSPLFYEMYQSLDNSNDVYYINYGSLNKEGQFQKNDKGGGTITFSSKIKDTKIPVLSEELFHAYQHDNRNRYDQGEFNREFEAKVFVHAVASDVGGISLFDNTNSFLSDIYNRKYGNDNKVITPMNVQSSHFLKSYYKFANIFADYNRKHKIGNINYRRYTTIPPYSLQTIVRNAY